MTIEINENDYGYMIAIEPETIEEAALLLRMSTLAKREPVTMTTYFEDDKIWLWNSIKKRRDEPHLSVSNTKR